ncbi:hypothetical protein CLU79DRAFT_736233 [Phycomyces nitens]|nr:hypothetical protein CLU79DRAFT_736233 [Phycomyces nitens]
MKLYRAETGQQVDWPSPTTPIITLENFKLELEKCTGIPIDSQILMTSFGTQVKESLVKEVLEATDKDEYIIFCYDRQYLGASPEEMEELLESEMPQFEPAIPPFEASTALQTLLRSVQKPTPSQRCESYLKLFAKFDAYSQALASAATKHTILARTIVNDQKSQRMALNVAVTNLESHNKLVYQGTQAFCSHAEKELRRQSGLLETTDIDLSLLKAVQIHPRFLEDIENTTPKSRLIDFVDEQRIVDARHNTHAVCNHLTQEIRELRALATDLKHYENDLQHQIAKDLDLQTLDSTLDDTNSMQTKSQFIRDKIKRDLGRIYSKIADLMGIPIETLVVQPLRLPVGPNTVPNHAKKAFEAFQHLAEIHVNDYLPKLCDYEQIIREKVTELARIKRQAIQAFLTNINIVSQLQSEIAAVTPRLELAESELTEFKHNLGQNDLEMARNVLFSYGALMIEVVRRNEYTTILSEHTNSMAGLLTNYHRQEEDRREKFRRDIGASLPFQIKSLLDSAPQCEIPIIPIQRSKIPITQKDIIAFITQLGHGYASISKEDKRKTGTLLDVLQRTSGSVMFDSTNSGIQSSRRTIQRDTQGERVIRLLNTMNKQLDGLKPELLKSIESTFFENNSWNNRASPFLGSGSIIASNAVEAMLQQKAKALVTAEDQIKAYETRIQSLEKALQQSFKATMLSPDIHKQINVEAIVRSESGASSAYSVIEDEPSIQKQDDSEELLRKLAEAEQKIEAMKQNNSTLQEAVDTLKEKLDTKDKELVSQQQGFEAERIKWEQERENDEHDREDLRLQIQELEQLLDDERQAYEDNRKSLLNEANIKDNLADIRVADVEEDWRAKTKELNENIEQYKKDIELIRKENNANITAMAVREEEVQAICSHWAEERRRLERQTEQLKNRLNSISNENKELFDEKMKLEEDISHIQKTLSDFQDQTRVEKQKAEDRLRQLTLEMGDSEQARDEIKQRLAQARDMVARAESDWMDKNEALERMVAQQTVIRTSVTELLTRYSGSMGPGVEDNDTIVLLDLFKQHLEVYTSQSNQARENLSVLQQEYMNLTRTVEGMNEERSDWHNMMSLMADKLEGFRKDVFYEMTHQLHLPVDENEAGLMTRRLQATQSSDQFAAWNEILQAANGIDNQKFVSRIRKKVKDAHELTRRWQKEYREVKDKYTKVASSAYEKIAFRNFKVGDVALFLPTRNSTGKPWAAFNVNAPHYFLKPSESIQQLMSSRDWIVARITSITECSVDPNDPTTNPFGLAHGLKFYQIEVENWRSHHHKSSKTHKSRHHEKHPKESLSTSETLSRRYGTLSQTSGPQDIGLASLSLESSQANPSMSASMSVAIPSRPTRPVFSVSHSSSNIVHSYAHSTSPPLASNVRRWSGGNMITSIDHDST